MIPQRFQPPGFSCEFTSYAPSRENTGVPHGYIIYPRRYSLYWLFDGEFPMFCCLTRTTTSVLLVNIIHASYHNVNIIMVNKIIEIDTAKADKKS